MELYDLCRFCLNFVENSRRKFLNQILKDQFEYLTNEKLISNVGSDFCCQDCLEKLKEAHSTKEIFLKNQEILIKKSGFEGTLPDFSELEILIKEENHDYDNLEDSPPEIVGRERTKNEKLKTSKKKKKSGKYTKKSNRKSDPAPCDVCGSILSGWKNLAEHKASVHEKVRKFFCDVCGHGMNRKSKLANHLKSHFKIKDVPCDECDKFFVSKDDANAHKKYAHLGIRNIKRVTCEMCGKVCGSTSKYKDHIRAAHTKEKPYVCKVPGCGKRFSNSSDFSKHKKIGHTDTTQTCQICFKQIKNLRSHMRLNHIERPFVCTFLENDKICGKKYSTNHDLKSHYDVIHCGVRKFACQHCESTFKCKSDHLCHVLNIHERRKIQCELCPAIVGSKGYYAKHIKSHHREMDFERKESFLKKIRETPEEKLFNYQK